MSQHPTTFPFRVFTAPFADGLTVAHFRGREALSRPYEFDLLALTAGPLAAGDLPAVGQPATLLIGRAAEDEEDQPRRVHGVLARVTLEGPARDREGSWLRLRLVPRLWGLARRRTRRIFQAQSAVDVVSAVLGDWGVAHRWQLDAPPEPAGYCVQYDETDLEFVARLLAQHGIYYYFEHAAADPGDEDAVETVVFCDAARHYPALTLPGESATRVLKLCERDGTYRPSAAVLSFAYEKRVRPTAARLRDYDFRAPQALGEAGHGTDEEPALGSERLLSDEFHAFSGNDAARVSRRDARRALEQHRADATRASGTSDCRDLSAGARFALNNHDVAALNAEWVVTEVSHEGRVAELARSARAGGASLVYLNTFRCAPASVPVRPPRYERPHRQAMETAVVVGPAGEEIYTDEFGRIKVQFHWDRDGGYDERSSCWVRVAQAWAGAGWGFQFVPRIGMEVLVSFVGGDTDHPVVVGCLYNGARPPSHALPEHKTRSGIRTLSSPGGAGHNELSFEDAAGEELVHLRAERDLSELVQRNRERRVGLHESVSVGGNRTVSVAMNQNVRVDGEDHREVSGAQVVVVRGDVLRETHGAERQRVEGNAFRRVQGRCQAEIDGPTFLRFGAGCHATVIDRASGLITGDLEVTAGEGGRVLVGTDLALEAGSSITLRVGGSSVRIEDQQVTVDTDTLVLRGRSAVKVLGDTALLKLDGDARLLGSNTKVQSSGAELVLDGNATLKGSKVKLASGGGASESQSNDSSSQGEQQYWRIKLLRPGSGSVDEREAMAGVSFTARGHGPHEYSGTTDGDGVAQIPRVYPRCLITLRTDEGEFRVRIVDGEEAEEVGSAEKLHRFGYGPDDVAMWSSADARRAYAAFREDHESVEPGDLED